MAKYQPGSDTYVVKISLQGLRVSGAVMSISVSAKAPEQVMSINQPPHWLGLWKVLCELFFSSCTFLSLNFLKLIFKLQCIVSALRNRRWGFGAYNRQRGGLSHRAGSTELSPVFVFPSSLPIQPPQGGKKELLPSLCICVPLKKKSSPIGFSDTKQ